VPPVEPEVADGHNEEEQGCGTGENECREAAGEIGMGDDDVAGEQNAYR